MNDSSPENSRRKELLSALLDGKLNERGETELLAEISADERFAREVVSLYRQGRLMETLVHIKTDASFVKKVLSAAKYARDDHRFVNRVAHRAERRSASRASGRASRSRPPHRSRAPSHTIRWPRWISIAACLAIIVGSLMYNNWRAGQFRDVLIAHITQTAPNVTIIRSGNRVMAIVNMEIYAGDTIRTAKHQNVRFAYDGEATEIEVKERTGLRIGTIDTGKRLHLEKGTIDAMVAPQPAGRAMIVLTPHSKAEVKGTAFSMAVDKRSTRLEVTDGIVSLTRLSDSTSVDVGTGQYALVAKGVELAAIALPESPARAPAASTPVVRTDGEWPAPRTHLDGKLLFEDDFDGPPVNWEVVIGNPTTGYDAVTANPERYWKALKTTTVRGGGFFRIGDPAKGPEDISLVVVNPGPEETRNDKRFVGIRSRRPVGAERFVVEARLSFEWHGQCWVPAIDMLETHGRVLVKPEKLPIYRTQRFCLYRWEFEPSNESPGKDVFVCRHFVDGKFRETTRVTPISTKMLFSINRPDLCMDRVTVRELLKE